MRLLTDAAARLDRLLLGPFSELAERPLVVVPTGALHSVPWSVLPRCAGRPITVSPSATLWHAANARRPGRSRVAVVAGPSLAGAVAEARAVAGIHGVPSITGEDATVAAVLAALGAHDLVHLATHGQLTPDNPLFSSLRLHDGPLVVYDLQRLQHMPHTVVLAACDSARSVVYTGDELLGLGAAFIARGVAQLVASVVPVPDTETAPLMIAFHQRLAAGEPVEVALGHAQQALRDGTPRDLAAAAGFVCIGGSELR
jgi:CHAT domain-containing protein